MKKYWLMKSEPDVFSLADLKACKNKTEPWDGIRNYQARNFMRDEMKVGDGVLFYHSNCDQPGVVGLAEVVKEAYPDHTAQDPESKYYDPKATPENPRWMMVDVQWKQAFVRTVTLAEMKEESQLQGMRVLQKGSRLSITPVTKGEFEHIKALGLKS